jgi:hypothetical protein
MAVGDITLYDESYGYPGDESFAVAASATLINAGEPVLKLSGVSGAVVTPLATNSPQSSASLLTCGIAATTSTNTASVAGIVKVTKPLAGITYLIAPKVAATFDTQAEYDALVGARVLIDLTAGSYTLLAADNAAYGCVVEPLDISKYPGKVRFSFRPAATYLGWATGIS